MKRRAVRRLEDRLRLERETAAYFQRLSFDALAEELKLESALLQQSAELDFDD